MAAYFNLNNNEISKDLLVNQSNMILGNQGRRVLNDQKISSPQNEPLQKQPAEVFLKISQILQENASVGVSFRPATLLKRDFSTGVFL